MFFVFDMCPRVDAVEQLGFGPGLPTVPSSKLEADGTSIRAGLNSKSEVFLEQVLSYLLYGCIREPFQGEVWRFATDPVLFGCLSKRVWTIWEGVLSTSVATVGGWE